MTTVNDILTKSFRKAGILTLNQTPTNDMANDALGALNDMLASWGIDSVNVYARTWESFTLTGGQVSYTIGTGGNFNTARPINIASSYVRIGGNSVDIPVVGISDEIYNEQITVKNISGIPRYFNYDNGYPLGTIRLWPEPSSAYSLFLLNEKPLAAMTLNQTFDLPPGWERAIIFNMADELCGDYGQETPDSVQRTAVKSFANIRRQVMKQRSLDASPQSISTNNIYTGWFT